MRFADQISPSLSVQDNFHLLIRHARLSTCTLFYAQYNNGEVPTAPLKRYSPKSVEISHDVEYLYGFSSWATSDGVNVSRRTLLLKLLLATNKSLQIQFMQKSPLLEWFGNQVKWSYVGALVSCGLMRFL